VFFVQIASENYFYFGDPGYRNRAPFSMRKCSGAGANSQQAHQVRPITILSM